MTEKGWIELLLGKAGLTVFLLLLCVFSWQVILNLQADNMTKEKEKDLLHERTLTYIIESTHAVEAHTKAVEENTRIMQMVADQIGNQRLSCSQ